MNEKTAGIIVFRRLKGEILYLLLYYNHGHGYWGFSKGHLEGKETNLEAAIRELKEETGITNIKLIEGFEKDMSYFFRKDKKTVFKEVVFFLAETTEEKITLSDEHSEFTWANYSKAIGLIPFENSQNILKEADRVIKVNFKN